MLETTKPKPFVFILMPFSDEFDDVYHLGLKPACKNAGAYAERVDEQIFQESILERIYNQIGKADIIIADMTGRNPNVFYETGYAHALGKPVILVTQNTSDIPFDLKHYPHIIYGGRIKDLIPEVEKRVKFLIDTPKSEAGLPSSDVEFYIDGEALIDEPEIKGYNIRGSVIYLQIDAHNPIKKEINSRRFQVGIETSDILDHSKGSDTASLKEFVYLNKIKQSTGRVLHLHENVYEVLPGAWRSIYFEFAKTTDRQFDFNVEKFVLKVFTDMGVRDFKFGLVEKKSTKK